MKLRPMTTADDAAVLALNATAEGLVEPLGPARLVLMTSGPEISSAEAASAEIATALTKPVLRSACAPPQTTQIPVLPGRSRR